VRVNAGVIRGERDVVFEQYRFKNKECRDRAIAVKKLLLAHITDCGPDDEVIEEYGLKGSMPRSRAGLKNFVDQLKNTSERLRAAGDPRVLEAKIIDDLVVLADEMIALWHQAQQKKQDAIQSNKEVKTVFRNDTHKLRLLYRYAVYKWGRYDPKLLLLGFVPDSAPKGHTRIDKPANFVFVWNDPELTFTWDPCEKATSYQLAYTEDDETWNELYAGADTTYTYTPPAGTRTYKVRARNVNGFSEWSENLTPAFS